MKNIFIIIFLLPLIHASAQLSVGPIGMTVITGTTLSSQGLQFVPVSNFNFTSNSVNLSQTPVSGTPVASINRVYNYGAPLSFNGVINLYYNSSELNGNDQTSLNLRYRSNGAWKVLMGSYNSVGNYVSYTTPSSITFDGVTAAETLTVLPLTTGSFTATLASSSVTLKWQMSNNDLYSGFQLEKSDGSSGWLPVGYIQAIASAADVQNYYYSDNEMSFEKRNYRLRIDFKTGSNSYSNIVSVTNKYAVPKVLVTSGSNSLDIMFQGDLPKQVFLFNANGQLVTKITESKSSYHLVAPTGIYHLQYIINGQAYTKKVLSR